MVVAIKRWLGIEALERENVILAKKLKALDAMSQYHEDHEARIAYLENRLTAKQSEAKIVPKAHKTTFRQFAEAASKASEEIEA